MKGTPLWGAASCPIPGWGSPHALPWESSRILCTGAFPNTLPPAFRITGMVWKAISPAPPLGYHAPWRKWFTRMLCMEKLALEGSTPGKRGSQSGFGQIMALELIQNILG